MFDPLNQYDSLGAETAALDLFRMFQTAGYGYEVEGFRPDVRTDVGPEYFGLDDEETTCWVQDQFGGWNPFKAVASAASSVAKAATSVVNTAAKVPGISAVVGAPKAALNIARGGNVASSIRGAVVPPSVETALKLARGGNVAQTLKGVAGAKLNEMRGQVKTVARNAAFVPGIGTGAASALSAGLAATEGKNLRQIAEEAAIGAVPGGEAYKTAIRTGIDVARGGNVLKSIANRGLEYAQTQVPGGELAQRALSVGLNVARGENVVASIAREGQTLAQRRLPTTASKIEELRARARALGTRTATGAPQNLRQIAEEAAIGAVPGGSAYKTTIRQEIDNARAGSVLKAVANPNVPAIPAGFRSALIGPNGQIIFR